MALLISILLAFFVPYPWNVLLVIGGASIEVLEVIWGRRLAKRWRKVERGKAIRHEKRSSI